MFLFLLVHLYRTQNREVGHGGGSVVYTWNLLVRMFAVAAGLVSLLELKISCLSQLLVLKTEIQLGS